MAKKQKIKWYEVDRAISGLETDIEHEIIVQREAIPLVFVPGIMGSRLRLAGFEADNADVDGLPNLRWDPGSSALLFNYSGSSGAHRKSMLVGKNFSSTFLEVDNASPVGDGLKGIFENYRPFLEDLKTQDWGPLTKIFELPVYAFGYNWTGSVENAGTKLAERINAIITEARGITGHCEKVILITHSMGGLVSRWASEKVGARESILGIIHGVQPTTGAPAAYWRMKAGFERKGFFDVKGRAVSRILGNSARTVTPVLANMPGGLQLLPNKHHLTNDHSPAWLTITQDGQPPMTLPTRSDPYNEIYRVKARVIPPSGENPSTNKYWGLVDPDLLDPGSPNVKSNAPPPGVNDSLRAPARRHGDPWDRFLDQLKVAEAFHDTLGDLAHPRTFCFHGVSFNTADVIELRAESSWLDLDPYPKRGFRGFFTNAKGKAMKVVLQDPAGEGDGTVPASSAGFLNAPGRPFPGDDHFEVEHQPAYEAPDAQRYTLQAIVALCKHRYDEHRAGDFPESQAATRTG